MLGLLQTYDRIVLTAFALLAALVLWQRWVRGLERRGDR